MTEVLWENRKVGVTGGNRNSATNKERKRE